MHDLNDNGNGSRNEFLGDVLLQGVEFSETERESDQHTCVALLMAMSTKLEKRNKDTTIAKSSFTNIYNGMDRETIRKKWKAFIREVWLRSVPFDDDLHKVKNILHKSELQTMLHAQSAVANTIYEFVFCNALKQPNIFHRLLSQSTQNRRLEGSENHCAKLYEVIPSPHGKLIIFSLRKSDNKLTHY